MGPPSIVPGPLPARPSPRSFGRRSVSGGPLPGSLLPGSLPRPRFASAAVRSSGCLPGPGFTWGVSVRVLGPIALQGLHVVAVHVPPPRLGRKAGGAHATAGIFGR